MCSSVGTLPLQAVSAAQDVTQQSTDFNLSFNWRVKILNQVSNAQLDSSQSNAITLYGYNGHGGNMVCTNLTIYALVSLSYKVFEV